MTSQTLLGPSSAGTLELCLLTLLKTRAGHPARSSFVSMRVL